MLARRVVAAADRYSVTAFLTGLAGADVGALDPVEPADPRDERVAVLVRVLQEWHWRALALDRLCADLVAVLEEWQSRRDATHSARRTPLEEH